MMSLTPHRSPFNEKWKYIMRIRDWLLHKHYWGTPHYVADDNRLIQICYECGKEREIKVDLHGKERSTEKTATYPSD
jgi:hypothetical protein